MAIPRVKKKTEKQKYREGVRQNKEQAQALMNNYQEAKFEAVRNANYVAFAITVRCLKCFGFGKKRIETFLEAYLALVQELADHRCTPEGTIQATLELTGVDAKKMMDEVYGWR